MKKLFLVLAAAFAMVACQTDLNEVSVAGGEVDVTFEVGAPAARAYSDGKTATRLQYAIYDETGAELTALTKTNEKIELSTTVQLKLVTGNKYTAIFWASEKDAPYEVDFGAKTMTVDYDEVTCNDEKLDAFYAIHEFTVTGAQTETIELKRPFAQLNIGTNDYTTATEAGYTPTKSAVTVKKIYKTLDLWEGGVSNPVEVIFATAPIAKTESFPVADYEYLAMNYLLVDSQKEVVDIEFTYTDGVDAKTRTVGSVPVQRNYRTNIYGQLLTSDVDINVVIKPEYENNALEAWDGVTLNEPTFNAETKTYYISHAAELAYIAALVNGTLDTDNVSRVAVAKNSLNGYTLSLECDINLNGKEWTPIGMGGNHFMGTLKGNNCTIHGLKISERPNGTSQAALFGTVSGTVAISDLTIKGANINGLAYTDKDFYGSALIGTMYGNVTIENVNVVDSYISGNNKVGALVAHDGVCSSLKISGCVVDNVTFESTCVADGGLVGGLVGFFQGAAPTASTTAPYGEHHIKNSHVKNSTFNVVNSTNTGKRGNSQFIGGIYSKANQNLYIDNCSVDNNTWNEKFYAGGVEVTEGKYESLFVAEDIVWIGGERNDNANGKVFVNGVEIVLLKPIIYTEDSETKTLKGIGTMGKTTNAAGNEVPVYGIISADGLKSINKLMELANARSEQYVVEGATFKLLADVDLTGVTTDGDSFGPIGRYCSGQGVNKPFMGNLDGQGHTIKGIYQSGWDFGYEWGTTGYLGLFGYVKDVTIENLTIEGMEAQVEGGTLAAIAGRADGECTFKNITVKNSKLGTYNNRCGGIVGWTGGYYKDEAETEVACHFTFENIEICEDVVLGGLWGSFDSSIGGVMGQLNSAGSASFKNVTVSCRIDAYNDCTASYDYYLYRMCGMLIGQMTKTTTIDGSTYPDVAAYGIEFDNVTVNYGTWMNYHYCEPTPGLNGGRGMRVEPGFTYGGLPADFDHTQCVDNHYNCIPFDQLFGGVQTACKGVKAWDGVTVNYPAEYTCTLCGQQHNVK